MQRGDDSKFTGAVFRALNLKRMESDLSAYIDAMERLAVKVERAGEWLEEQHRLRRTYGRQVMVTRTIAPEDARMGRLTEVLESFQRCSEAIQTTVEVLGDALHSSTDSRPLRHHYQCQSACNQSGTIWVRLTLPDRPYHMFLLSFVRDYFVTLPALLDGMDDIKQGPVAWMTTMEGIDGAGGLLDTWEHQNNRLARFVGDMEWLRDTWESWYGRFSF